MSEREFTNLVAETLVTYGWWFHHDTPAHAKGEDKPRTHLHRLAEAGFPDIVAAKVKDGAGYLIVWELKTRTGKATPAQVGWLKRLPGARIMRPADWDLMLDIIAHPERHLTPHAIATDDPR